MKKMWGGALLITGFIAFACKDNDNIGTVPALSAKDISFFEKAGPLNEAIIELSALDSASTSDSVRSFSKSIISYQQASLSDLKALAGAYGRTIATTLDNSHAAMKTRLTGYDAATLDSAYLHSELNDQQAAVNLYQSEIDSGYSPSVKDYAVKYLTTLKMHAVRIDSLYNNGHPTK